MSIQCYAESTKSLILKKKNIIKTGKWEKQQEEKKKHTLGCDYVYNVALTRRCASLCVGLYVNLGFLLQNMCKRSVAENGVIDSPRKITRQCAGRQAVDNGHVDKNPNI